MGEADAPRITSSMEFPGEGGAVVAPQAAAAVPASQPSPAPRPAPVTTDPLSRPYTLPSRGLYYPAGQCSGGQVVISPMRGAQEEILAGAQDSAAALPVLRHVAEQCVNTQGLAFNELLLFDFTALLFHFLALSNGTDELTLTPLHAGNCGKSFQHVLPLTELPCTTLRQADPGEEPNWPRERADEEDAFAILAEMDAEAAGDGQAEYVLAPDSVPEPFVSGPLPVTGDVIGWRYHRVRDVIQAEEFVARAKQGAGKLHSFLLAAQLVTLNGRAFTGRLEAMTWVTRQPSPLLHALRDDLSARDFGYDVNPRFRCPHCGGSFKGRLPLDGSLFRRRRR